MKWLFQIFYFAQTWSGLLGFLLWSDLARRLLRCCQNWGLTCLGWYFWETQLSQQAQLFLTLADPERTYVVSHGLNGDLIQWIHIWGFLKSRNSVIHGNIKIKAVCVMCIFDERYFQISLFYIQQQHWHTEPNWSKLYSRGPTYV